MKLLKNKKGFSIVEVVVAMLVISVVSATALSIVSSSADNTQAAMYKADAQYLVADALECFKVSGSKDEFLAALEYRGDLAKLTLQNAEGNADQTDYYMVKSGYSVVVLTDYTTNPNRPNFSIRVFDKKGQMISDLSYTKTRR